MHYNTDKAAVEITADEIADTCFRTGSLGDHRAYSYEALRQDTQTGLVEKNVFFTPDKDFICTSFFSGIHYEVSGRADGIIRKDGGITLCLICPVRGRKFGAPPPERFVSKANILAFLASAEYEVEKITVSIILVNADTRKTREINKEYSSSELRRTYMGYLAKLERFARVAISRETCGRTSITSMKFPFESIREGQRELIEETYRTIHDGTRLFAQAPTGIGKTMSVLYPSVKAVGAGLCDKIFYLTAKASTRREAFSAIRKMFEAGAELRAVVISSKEQMCECAAAKYSGRRIGEFCRAEKCEFACGYYERIQDALCELLGSANGYTSRLISEVARKYKVCPYELSLDISEYCDIVICDYNYVFDPHVYFRRYFDRPSDENGEKYVFLIDEAHNLADRARETYSASLSVKLIEKYFDTVLQSDGKLSSYFEEMLRTIRSVKRLCSDNLIKDDEGEHGFYIGSQVPSVFCEKLMKFAGELDTWCKSNRDDPLSDGITDLRGEIGELLSVLELYDEHFRTYVLVDGDEILVKLYCIDPSHLLDICMRRSEASVLFSATLTPTDYFVDVLGGGKKAVTLDLPSPFPRENLCLTAMTGISTRHADRDTSAMKTAVCIAAAVLPKKGNYIAYFPSYSYMERVANAFRKKFPKVNVTVQTRGMTHVEKEQFLGFFKEDTDVLRIGFCVLGGSFSEGVDLPGSRLIGSIIVGVGLPGLSNDLNIIRDFYEEKYERGYDYAYTYPGMIKVLQACGRVIRREDDRGIVVLIDDRYETPQYKALFPAHWENINFASSASELAKIIEDFWKNENNV